MVSSWYIKYIHKYSLGFLDHPLKKTIYLNTVDSRYLEFDGIMEKIRVNHSSTQEELRRYRKCGLFNNERETTRPKFLKYSDVLFLKYSDVVLFLKYSDVLFFKYSDVLFLKYSDVLFSVFHLIRNIKYWSQNVLADFDQTDQTADFTLYFCVCCFNGMAFTVKYVQRQKYMWAHVMPGIPCICQEITYI